MSKTSRQTVTGETSYDVVVGRDVLDQVALSLPPGVRRVLVVYTDRVAMDTRPAVYEADKLGDLIPSIERERIRAASETMHEVVPIGLARNGAGGFQHDDGLTVVLDANRRLETECQRVGF